MPSCNTRRMVETAAHLVDHVFPHLPVRQWVVSVPKRLRYFLQRDSASLNAALRIVLRVIEQHLRDCSPGAGPKAKTGAVAFIHRFGDSLNEHIHFPVCVIDGVLEAADEQSLAFFEATALDADAIAQVQTTVRRRILRAFVRRGLLESDVRKEMEHWNHGGGFSVDASVRIEGRDRQALERLLRYCARPPFALERIEALDSHRLIYHLSKATQDGRTQLILSPLELIALIAALVPPPRSHRHRNSGVLAPNAPLRTAVTALAHASAVDCMRPAATPEEHEAAEEAIHRSPARYLWAMLLARIYEVFPLTCPQCGAPMRIIAFITEFTSIQPILEHIGEPSKPPRIAPARGPPGWDCDDASGMDGYPQDWDSAIEPEPPYELDQRISW